MSPAESESQQKLMAIALKIKRGEAPKSYSPQAAELAETMSESDLEDFSSKMEKSENLNTLVKYLRKEQQTPPRPGLVFDRQKHRWVRQQKNKLGSSQKTKFSREDRESMEEIVNSAIGRVFDSYGEDMRDMPSMEFVDKVSNNMPDDIREIAEDLDLSVEKVSELFHSVAKEIYENNIRKSKMEKSEKKERMKKILPLVPILVGAGGALAGKKIAETVLSDDNNEETMQLGGQGSGRKKGISGSDIDSKIHRRMQSTLSSKLARYLKNNPNVKELNSEDIKGINKSDKKQKTKKGFKNVAGTGVGSGLGAAVGGPIGAAIGGIAGNKLTQDKKMEKSKKKQSIKKLGPLAIAGLAGLAGGAGMAAGKKLISNQEEKSCDKETVKKISPLVASGGRALLGYAAGKTAKKVDRKVDKKIGLNKGGPGSGKKSQQGSHFPGIDSGRAGWWGQSKSKKSSLQQYKDKNK